MLIENQQFEIKITKRNIEHYTLLGYQVNTGDIIKVPPEHLTKGCNKNVQVLCDFCKTNQISIPYYAYYQRHVDGEDACIDCINEKRKLSFMKKYGVEHVSQLDSVKEKVKQTNLQKYGTEFYTQTEEFKQKSKQTNLKKYGVAYASQSQEIQLKIKNTTLDKYGVEYAAQSKDIKEKTKQTMIQKYNVPFPAQLSSVKEKMKQTCLKKYGVEYSSQSEGWQKKFKHTCLEKYGVENPFQSEEIKEKIKQTCISKYGVDNPLKNKEILEKMRRSLTDNKTGKISQPQIQLYNIVKAQYPEAILNYPYSTCTLDIFVEIHGIKIDIEYDGSYWHQNKQRDIRRDKFLQSEGFKTLRVRSGHLIPTEKELFDTIEYLVNTEHNFGEIVLSDWKTVDETQQND